MKTWHFRFARALVYGGAAVAAVGIVMSAGADPHGPGHALVEVRQLFGLWALGLMLAALMIGPLTSVIHWLPLKPTLLNARRAVGVSSAMFSVIHVIAYLISVARRSWTELYTPGVLWVAGGMLGIVALADLIALAWTSRDASVRSMGGRRWKRLHRTALIVLPIVLLHATFMGADFGINHGPDVNRHDNDFGSLFGFGSVVFVWAILLLLRHKKSRLSSATLVGRSK